MSDTFSSELMRELNDASNQPDEEEVEIEVEIEVKYTVIPGLRQGSEILWAYDERQLYYKNSYSRKRKTTG